MILSKIANYSDLLDLKIKEMAGYRQLIEKHLDSEYELDEVTSDVVLELLNEIQENAKKIDSQTTTIWLDLRNYRMAEEAKSNETV